MPTPKYQFTESLKQYTDLYEAHSQLIAEHSPAFMNACRKAAFSGLCDNGLPTRKVECYKYTNVDAAEDHQELALLLNARAVENLAVAMKEVDGWLVHISTDYVFGKEPYNRPCREDQQGTPSGVYGWTKLQGEQAVLASGVRHIIIRTAWLYSEFGNNFVKTILRLTAQKPSLKVVFDQVGTPTYAGDLAHAIVQILQQVEASPQGASAFLKVPGGDASACIFHYSNEGVCS